MTQEQKKAHERMLAALPRRVHVKAHVESERGHQEKRGAKRGRALKLRPDDIFEAEDV